MPASTTDSRDPTVDLIDRLQKSYAKTLDALLPPGSRVVLLEYPSHWNIGDHLIWLGETTYLSHRPDLSVHYISDRFTYSHKSLARHLPRDGVILLHGGGNFGDIYPQVQRMREAVIEHFPKNRFIQLSQTISFDNPDAAKGTAAVLERHPDFTLLARDRQGLEFARALLPCKVELCVDAAFMLGIQRRTRPVENQIMWIARRDGEGLHTPIAHPTGTLVFDWEDVERDPRAWTRAYRWSRVQAAGLANLRTHGGPLAPWGKRLTNTFDDCSWVHADAGFQHLSRAQVLVTDRLHGHIMAVLLDLPHVLLDNADSKLRRFYETWTHSAACAHWADTPEQALELAQSLSRSQPTD
jgi:exopolysaccharide biosynthesis predicted pyruvyltransferase EpsI